MEIRLTVVGPKTRKTHVSLTLPATIGRSREADLTVAHPMISRRHCKLFEVQGLLRVQDLGSLNGTFVGGEAISEAPLRPNDEFSIGPVTFRVDYEYGGEATADVIEQVQLPGLEPAPALAGQPGSSIEPGQPEHEPSWSVPGELFRPSGEEPEAPGRVRALSEDREASCAPASAPFAPGPAGTPGAVAPPDGRLPDFSDWVDAGPGEVDAAGSNQRPGEGAPPVKPGRPAPPYNGGPLANGGAFPAGQTQAEAKPEVPIEPKGRSPVKPPPPRPGPQKPEPGPPSDDLERFLEGLG
ncbi:MAG: FHA domain-containing protein [Thermoguttaceae bacterium]